MWQYLGRLKIWDVLKNFKKISKNFKKFQKISKKFQKISDVLKRSDGRQAAHAGGIARWGVARGGIAWGARRIRLINLFGRRFGFFFVIFYEAPKKTKNCRKQQNQTSDH